MRKHTPNTDLNVSGHMNRRDAGFVGKVLALATLVAAFAPVIWAVGSALADVIAALSLWR